MRKTTYKRFDGLSTKGNVREYKETRVTYTWPKNEEIVHRYLTRFYPKLQKVLIEPSINEPSFGAWVREAGNNMQFKTKCCAGISYDDIFAEYNFSTKIQKKFALKQIVSALETIKEYRK